MLSACFRVRLCLSETKRCICISIV
jgi:hypothetical protein